MKTETDITHTEDSAHEAATMLKMLAHPKRLMVLCYLFKAEHTVSQLIDLTNLSQSALSQHLSKMHTEGLVQREKRGKMVYYRVTRPDVAAILSTLYLIYCHNN